MVLSNHVVSGATHGSSYICRRGWALSGINGRRGPGSPEGLMMQCVGEYQDGEAGGSECVAGEAPSWRPGVVGWDG